MNNGKNGLFWISLGCVLIMSSYLVPAPLCLIAAGLALVISGAAVWKKERRKERKAAR